MREGLKKKVHAEISSVLVVLGERENELSKKREEEEKNPATIEAALEEVTNSPHKEHKASVTTIARLLKIAEKRDEIRKFQENVLGDISIQTPDTEMTFYSDVQEYCSKQKKLIKLI